MNKILVIVGPTSSGKSELAIKLAKHFNGEIISCDSRQIYKGMDLGTGKIPGKWSRSPSPFLSAIALATADGRGVSLPCTGVRRLAQGGEGSKKNNNRKCFIYKNILHHCIDYVNPKKQYSAALFQRDAKKAIADILARGKLPILCGGTAHWIDAVVYNQQLPDVKPNAKLRKQLEKLSTVRLFARISRLDPERAKTIDRYNRRRLIRALEIVIISGHPVPSIGDGRDRPLPYNALWIGITLPQLVLFSKIQKRLKQRLDAGMIKEVRQLHSPLPLGEGLRVRVRKPRLGLSWRRLESFGLEYRYVSLYLQKKIAYDEMQMQLSLAIKHYSKRQLTWWKRNKKIYWLTSLNQANKSKHLPAPTLRQSRKTMNTIHPRIRAAGYSGKVLDKIIQNYLHL